jgi:Family of unknown function (DUF5752)
LEGDGLFRPREKAVNSTEPFALVDCSLARFAIGRSCSNLRELLEAIPAVPDTVLEHHMMRCVLEDHFELNEFPNDLARWCWDALGDRALAERLGLVDPYQHETIATLREALVNAIEDRLWGCDRVPWCRPGLELHLTGSQVVAFDTGERLPTLAALGEALPRISLRSFFYHVHEARRCRGNKSDDFSHWLENIGADASLVAKLRAIDFYFLNLTQLRLEFIEAFRQHLAGPQVLLRVIA